MKRSLSAGPRPTAGDAGGDDAVLLEASDEEVREARALAEAIARGEEPLTLALQHATRSSEIDAADHEALLARVLGDVDEEAPPTKAEQRAADRLREALAGEGAHRAPPAFDGGASGELGELADSLRAAWRPQPLSELQNRRLIERALLAPAGTPYRRIAPVTMAVLPALAAIAAGVALFFGAATKPEPLTATPASRAMAPSRRAALIPARTTTALFDPATPFPIEGGQTERIDRIASARAADLRTNRYAAWGVR